MITVPQADAILQKNTFSCSSECVPLEAAFGCVLHEDVVADRDLPPFDRATMDGIAVKCASFTSGVREFPIKGLQKAGMPASSLKKRNGCFEIMTGAMLPQGCDCVIPVEYLTKERGRAHVHGAFSARPMLHVHPRGCDARKGEVLLKSGCRLAAAQIAVAAAVGKSKICVSRSPKIAVVGTGDELVEISRTPKPFQIRRSNTYALAAALTLQGYSRLKRFHLPDNEARLLCSLEKILASYDVVIISGGVSAGNFDFVPSVLKKLGVKILFHRVKQRPGGPFLFGRAGGGKPVFGLPGNPVSTQICFYRYVLPYLNKSMGLPDFPGFYVALREEVRIKTPLTHFLPVKLSSTKDGRLTAVSLSVHTSGDYVALTHSDGFIEVSAGTSGAAKGSAWPLYLFS